MNKEQILYIKDKKTSENQSFFIKGHMLFLLITLSGETGPDGAMSFRKSDNGYYFLKIL